MLENCDKIMYFSFNFDACLMHSPFGFLHMTYQNLSARALICHNSFANVNMQLLIYNYEDVIPGILIGHDTNLSTSFAYHVSAM